MKSCWSWFSLERLAGSECRSIACHRLTVFSSCCVCMDWQKFFEQTFLNSWPIKRVTNIGLISLNTLKNASVQFFPNLFPKSFLKRVAYYICLFTISLSITFKVLDKSQETARILDGLAGCLTELCASDFYWIFSSFRLSLIF